LDVTTVKESYILVTWGTSINYTPGVVSPARDIYHTGAALD